MAKWLKSFWTWLHTRPDTADIIQRLKDRHLLMEEASGSAHLSSEASVMLQARVSPSDASKTRDSGGGIKLPTVAICGAVAEAVRYRLAITDLFVEKAQYHLERRARRYAWLGNLMYLVAIVVFSLGALLAICRMKGYRETGACSVTPVGNSFPDATHAWIELLTRFTLAFTAYGFVVLTAVALSRGARACLDQRERLLAKRHSLRQGRLFLHLTGGHVTIRDMERAFNWNHEQDNAFTHMATDAKAPWGKALEEVIKITPELVKAGVSATRKAGGKSKTEMPKNGSKKP